MTSNHEEYSKNIAKFRKFKMFSINLLRLNVFFRKKVTREFEVINLAFSKFL